MAETDKLFYEDAYIKEFDAVVLSCEPEGNGFHIVLDQTAFFPEGGGQYGDIGYLGKARVLDTREENGVVFHFTDIPLKTGSEIHGKLDWEERFSRMQQHTAEHIISGIVHRRFGYDNVGFHLGTEDCTMDFNGVITAKQLKEIEEEANRAVFSNLEIRVFYPEQTVLEQLEYRSKIEIEEKVRLVEIPGMDLCACCAPHVLRTGEIGLVKLVAMENYKGGERVHMLSGFRALADYQRKHDNVKQIGALLCEKEYQVAEGVQRLKHTEDILKQQIGKLKRELLICKSREIKISEKKTVVFDRDLSGDEARELMNLLLERGAEICAVFAGTGEGPYRYVIGSKTEDVRSLNQKMKIVLGARGGGKPEMVQGSVSAEEQEIRKVIK